MMINNNCDICGGSGKIRLPVRGQLHASPDLGKSPMSLPIREYSCPECGYKIPEEKLMIVQAEERVSREIEAPDYIEHCQRNISLKMGDFLFREGQIKFSKIPLDDYMQSRYEYSLRGTLGVISPRVVATFEERVRQNQDKFANAVIQEAAKQIRNWASDYGELFISKETAIREMEGAMANALNLRIVPGKDR